MDKGGQPLTSRQRQAIETRARIKEAANQLFMDRDYEVVSIADICSRAGVAVGSFYNHYRSKEGLILSISQEFDEYAGRRGPEIVNDPTTSCLQKIVALVGLLLDWESNKRLVAQFYRVQLKEGQGGQPSYLSAQRPLETSVRQVIDLGKERGELSADASSETIASGVMRISRGVIFDWLQRDDPYDPREQIREDLSLYLASLMSEEGRRPADAGSRRVDAQVGRYRENASS